MKVSYGEGLASHAGPKSCDSVRKGVGEALTGVRTGPVLSFNFLGFTHSCGKTREGGFTVLRQTMRTRWQGKLREVKAELRRRLHEPIQSVGTCLRSVVLGHVRLGRGRPFH